ncbi:MAG TPA: hypothetical protein VGU23_03010, partial [Acidobacteriaceae bacterium]|nr:hypothetical protein [Acidobacteriaceae bacterium]
MRGILLGSVVAGFVWSGGVRAQTDGAGSVSAQPGVSSAGAAAPIVRQKVARQAAAVAGAAKTKRAGKAEV